MLTDGSTDRLITGLIGGRMILVGFCHQSHMLIFVYLKVCIRRGGHLRNVNDAELKYLYSEEMKRRGMMRD